MRWILPTLAVLLASGLTANSVRGHGRFPTANGLIFHPTDADLWVVQSTRGLMVTRDGGATWHWLCLEVAGASSFGQEDPAFAMMGDGALVAASGLQGVIRSDATWCDWVEVALSDQEDYFVIDQARHPSLPDRTFVVTSSGAPTVNGVFRSDDSGHTWVPTADGGVDAVLFESIAIAPSDPDVIYLTAWMHESSARTGALYVSHDGGLSWGEPTTFPLHDGETWPVVAGVDPTDPGRVFLRVMHDDFLAGPPPERLLLSEDHGRDLKTVLTAPHIRSFAVADDGITAWAGDDEAGGLWRSTDGGHQFAPLHEGLQVHCLEWHEDQLWICTNDAQEGHSIAVSHDGGESLQPKFGFDDIQGLLPCPNDGLLETCDTFIVCDALPELGLDPDALAPEANCGGSSNEDAGAPASDAGEPEMGGGEGGGCGCTVLPSSAPNSAVSMVTLLLWLGWQVRRVPSRRRATTRLR